MTRNKSQYYSSLFPSFVRGIQMLDILSDYYIFIKELVD